MDPIKNHPNKSKWIERYRHETIVSQYKTKVQSIATDYDTKIAIQSRRIDILIDTIRQQREIIDSFVLNRRPIGLDINKGGMNLKSPVGIQRSNEDIANEYQCKPGEQDLEPSSAQITNDEDEAKDAVLLAIKIQPNVKRFECNLCDKAFLSKRVLTVSIDAIDPLNRNRFQILMFNC